MSLNPENTEIAFKAKSDAALRRSYWLYRLLNSAKLVKLGEGAVKAAFKLHLPISPIIRASIFSQFCGGETIEECAGTIKELARFNIGTVLDYSVEGAHTEESFEATTKEILSTVQLASRNISVAFCVFKISGIAPLPVLEKKSRGGGLNADESTRWEKARHRLLLICEAAHTHQVRIFIDAEESWIQGAIDELAEEMMARFNQKSALIYNTLQMYRSDRIQFLQASLLKAKSTGYFIGLKLVRGAYMEKERTRAADQHSPSPILPDKASTDAAYDEALAFCIDHIDVISLCSGTHNERSTILLTELMEKHSLKRSDRRISFSQLLGMGDHLSYNLGSEGYCVAKYVPYGPVRSVMPYLFRRAEENTSMQGQTSRELSLIEKEISRRKTKD